MPHCHLKRYHLLSLVYMKFGTKNGTKNFKVPDEIY
jgi:hypothetical protein